MKGHSFIIIVESKGVLDMIVTSLILHSNTLSTLGMLHQPPYMIELLCSGLMGGH